MKETIQDKITRKVSRAEEYYLQDLLADMEIKRDKWQRCTNQDKARFERSYRSAQLAYWKEKERLSFGDDHEEGLAVLAGVAALTLYVTPDVDSDDSFDDNYYNDWIGE